MCRLLTPLLLAVLVLAAGATTPALGQVASMQGRHADEYGLLAVSGEVTPSSLREGHYAIIFFLPEGCPACEMVAAWAQETSLEGLEMVFVTNASGDNLASWVNSHDGLNVMLDSRGEFGGALRVTEVPTVYMAHNESILNAEHWPFYDGLAGLEANLLAFAAGAYTATPGVNEALAQLRPADLLVRDLDGNILALTDLSQPGLYMVCTPTCSVCVEELEYLAGLPRTEREALPPLSVIVVTEPDSDMAVPLQWSRQGFSVFTVPRDDAGPLNVAATPAHFAIDEEGTIFWTAVGFFPGIEAEFSILFTNQ